MLLSSYISLATLLIPGSSGAVQAVPTDKPMTWRDTAELRDLYSVYLGRDHDPINLAMLGQLLGISATEAESLQDLVSSGEFHLEPRQKEEAFF